MINSHELEGRFHILMRSIYDRAKAETGYNALRFKKMLETHGGVQTAKILLQSPTESEGFVELYGRNRLDLTVEAQLLSHDEYWSLFTETELDSARKWLKKYEYKY